MASTVSTTSARRSPPALPPAAELKLPPASHLLNNKQNETEVDIEERLYAHAASLGISFITITQASRVVVGALFRKNHVHQAPPPPHTHTRTYCSAQPWSSTTTRSSGGWLGVVWWGVERGEGGLCVVSAPLGCQARPIPPPCPPPLRSLLDGEGDWELREIHDNHPGKQPPGQANQQQGEQQRAAAAQG